MLKRDFEGKEKLARPRRWGMVQPEQGCGGTDYDVFLTDRGGGGG